MAAASTTDSQPGKRISFELAVWPIKLIRSLSTALMSAIDRSNRVISRTVMPAAAPVDGFPQR
jgi:hypothetical protein